MLRFRILVIFVIILILSIYNVKATNNYPLYNKIICIDPGHGGKDSGTNYNEIYEKNINLSISNYLNILLSKNGAIVNMTRDGDYDLSKPNASRRKKSDFDNRIKIINSCDLYISIHINYLGNSKYHVAQVFYNNDNKLLAKTIQDEFSNNLNSNMKIKKMSSTYYLYRKLNIPGILIECGFISNTNERLKLITSDYQEEIATSITNGLINYFS